MAVSATMVVATACGGDGPSGPADGVEAATLAWAVDWDNLGDGRDLRVGVRIPADEGGIAAYRVVAVPVDDERDFDAGAAATLPGDRVRELSPGTGAPGETVAVTLAAATLDSRGEPVREGVAYRPFLLTVPRDAAPGPEHLSRSPEAVTLARTHLVRTVTDPVEAGTGGLAVDAEGRIYMADFGETLSGPPGAEVYRITPGGAVSVFADGLSGASGNVFGPGGDLFQSNISAGRVSRISPDGAVETYATGLSAPVGVVFGPGDTLYVANCGDDTLKKVAPDGTTLPFVDSPLLACPNGITRADDGNLYVANFGNGDVLRVTPGGQVGRLATLPGGNNGHLLFGNGLLYVAARGAHQIWTVTLQGDATLLAGSGARGARDGAAPDARLSLTNDIALSPDGRTLYFNDVGRATGPVSAIQPTVLRAVLLVDGVSAPAGPTPAGGPAHSGRSSR